LLEPPHQISIVELGGDGPHVSLKG